MSYTLLVYELKTIMGEHRPAACYLIPPALAVGEADGRMIVQPQLAPLRGYLPPMVACSPGLDGTLVLR